MPSVMIVDEIKSSREELARALEAEGFRVVQSDSAASAVREIWEGTFIVAFIASILEGTNAQQLAEQLQNMAPEIETIIHSKSDAKNQLVRKAVEIRDGVAAA
jgi:DNA-binding NtrC family response regulator